MSEVRTVVHVYRRRGNFGDYHACLDGKPLLWSCGKTPDDAIESLMRSHPEAFQGHVECRYLCSRYAGRDLLTWDAILEGIRSERRPNFVI